MDVMCQDCQSLHQQLQTQAEDMYKLKRAIIKLRGELKYEQVERGKLLKEKRENKKKQHYRNGQKRGKTRNG